MSDKFDISLADAAKKFPSRPPVATVRRWIVEGFGGVKLKAIRSGKFWFTSESAIQAFIEATTAASLEAVA